MAGGIIHKPMFERLILCEYAVADLTTANANVFYELGVRHAVRPCSTVLIFAQGRRQLPFDVAPLRALPYALDARRDARGRRTRDARRSPSASRRRATAPTDSPRLQLVDGLPRPIDRTQDRRLPRAGPLLRGAEEEARRRAREQGAEAVRAVEAGLEPIGDARGGRRRRPLPLLPRGQGLGRR